MNNMKIDFLNFLNFFKKNPMFKNLERKKCLIQRTLVIYLKWKVLKFYYLKILIKRQLVIFNYVFLNKYFWNNNTRTINLKKFMKFLYENF